MLAESIPWLRDYDRDARVYVDMSEDRLAGFRHNHDSLSSRLSLSRAEVSEGLLHGLSQFGNLLRECSQSDSARRREGLPAGGCEGYRRIHCAWRNAIGYRVGISFVFHSLLRSVTSRSSNRYSQK